MHTPYMDQAAQCSCSYAHMASYTPNMRLGWGKLKYADATEYALGSRH